MSRATLTDRTSPAVRKRLGQLAGIKRGIDDMQAGRVVPHKQAMRRMRATVGRAAKAKI